MTIITREYPTEIVARPVRPRPDVRRGPQRRRPANEPLRYRGTGVLMSRASNRRKPITPATTVLLALVAAAITVWLGLVAQFGAPAETPAPGQLAVVQVQTGSRCNSSPSASHPTRLSPRSSTRSAN